MNTLFVSGTRASKPDDTLLGRSFIEQQDTPGSDNIKLHLVYNNTQKLPVVYNSFITQENKDSVIVFVHDDVSLNVSATVFELQKALKDHDVVGLAGCTTAKIGKPALWHLMAPRQNLSGAVAHPIAKDSKEVYMTSFGPYPQRCLMMDGLFLAVKVSSLLRTDVRFDESNPAIAHYYDLDFCLAANQAQLKLTTWPIYVTHRSPGLMSTEDTQWKAGQEWFINKWGKAAF